MAQDGAPHRMLESPRAEQRVAFAAEFLRGLPPRSPALIVADNHAAAQWLMSAALPVALGARFAWHRRTLGSLAEELALPALARAARVPLKGLGMLALSARVVAHKAERAELGRYAKIALQPGFARALSGTLCELRGAAIAPEDLAPHDPELAGLYQAYLAALDELALADEPLVVQFASAALRGKTRFFGLPLVLLDVELASPVEGALVRALCEQAGPVCATLARGDELSEARLREALSAGHVVERVQPEDAHDLARLQAYLFSGAALPPANTSASVHILSCPGESREAVEVVRGVLQKAKAGVAFDRMAIAVRASEVYRAAVEEALLRADIPAHYADGVRRPLPEGRALLLLIECARDGLSASAFADYLALGVMKAADGDAKARRGRWERLLRRASVGGSRARWLERLALLREALCEEAQVRAEENLHTAAALDLAALDDFCAFLQPLLCLLEELTQRCSWGAFLPALEALAEHALADAEPVREALRELAPLAEVGGVSLVDVARVLAPRLSSVIVRSQGHGAGKLWVGTPRDLRGRDFAVVFTVGLAEQLFPPRLHEDPLLPDRLRRRISADLPVVEERAAKERLALRVCVGAATDELYLSYPRFDLEHGRPRVPSFYGLEVLRALDGTLPAFDELTRRAERGAAARMGFPAPEQPEAAIDDAEYDVALLGELLRLAKAERAGGLRYLLAHHAHLARALRFRARRWTLARFSAADGFVASDDATRALLAEHQLSTRSYAPSSLAELAVCPYRFYLRAIVGLYERDTSFDHAELDARERGVLMHRVQQATFSGLRDAGLLPLLPAHKERALAILEAQFARLVQLEQARRDQALAKVLDESLLSLRHDLREWLQLMIEGEGARWTPQFCEFAFGVRAEQEVDPASVASPAALPGLKLKGVIDLVERHEARAAEARVQLRVTDHKSGLPDESTRRVITKGGTLLQPLLYALAVEQLFPEAHVSEGRLYFCTTRAGFKTQSVPLDAEARAVFAELVQCIDGFLREGFFPAAPAKDACSQCPYLAVCGPYEEKERVPVVKAKDLSRLKPLFHLRNLP